MTIDQLEMQSILNFLYRLHPPVHIILLYRDLSELDYIESKIGVEASKATAPERATDRIYVSPSTRQSAINGWIINRIGHEALTDSAKLIEWEKRIMEGRQQLMSICAYPLEHVLELDESFFVDILSLHDHILFPRLMEGQNMVLEAVEEALESVLGRSGSEMIYRFAHHMGIERAQIPSKLRLFRHILREILGVGADFLERSILRRLYLKLRSNSWVACADG